ncbi:OmpH family outer membrane protein [Paraglaciecola psychrophila]|uniref:Outer membrane chaperone Skp n=1 Tax=Paraglaciecola psychrophila 170 TaxID=1129794 RepID=K6Z2K4_9ALTE|nr:OmpH family outer membrane protein [Paraglaciecola psychrophila]AGH46199.1 Outer membrane chaperone Skp [Paraglaciecola psychrophila 170]GAC39274.1 chaperone protein skp [Paraglaciecola psychrophila 170]
MKKFTKSLIAGALITTAMASSAVFAEQKIGAVNVQGIFQAMPQAASIQENIAAQFKDKTEEVSRLEKDIKYYLEKNQRDAATMSAKEKTELEGKIIALREEYTAKAQPLQQEIQARLKEEQNKLLGLIKQGIDAVAAKEKYDVILNANSVAFINPDNDISKSVLEQIAKIN